MKKTFGTHENTILTQGEKRKRKKNEEEGKITVSDSEKLLYVMVLGKKIISSV